ncbi:MAG: phosphopantetheine-binding protein [Gammaproteobacteria bacterium]
MLTEEKIIEQIKEALLKTLPMFAGEPISLTDRLKEKYGLDSMTSLSFLMELENSIPGFVVNPDNLQSEHLETIASVACYVEQEMEGNT